MSAYICVLKRRLTVQNQNKQTTKKSLKTNTEAIQNSEVCYDKDLIKS